MLSSIVLVAALAVSVGASPLAPRSAAPFAGSVQADAFPPAHPTHLASYFPGEEEVGFKQTTTTGAEPFAYQTAIAAPAHTNVYPLVVPAPAPAAAQAQTGYEEDEDESSEFNSARYWANVSPQYSVPSSTYGLPHASPKVPSQCSLTQVHMLYRHGSRYPSAGDPVEDFAARVSAAARNVTSGGFTAWGSLSFLNTWTYKLGQELLVPFGRKQNFDHGVAARMAYGHLLNNFAEQGALPVFRTDSQDRMVKTAQNFAAGFFGIPAEDQYHLSIQIEDEGFNNTLAGYTNCPNAYLDAFYPGYYAQQDYYAKALAPTVARLNKLVDGIEFSVDDVTAMLSLCGFESVALGFSAFCSVFTRREFEVWQWGNDIEFYGDYFMGNPTAAAQGLGYVQELLARLTHEPLTKFNSATNATLDGNNITFPLNQSIYADATHEIGILNVLATLNLTSIQPTALNGTHPESDGHTFQTSKVVPMASFFTVQVMECSTSVPTKQIRFILNDAVVPQTYDGCDPKDENGLCAVETVVKALRDREAEIDFEGDCAGNYTVPPGIFDYNGRANSLRKKQAKA